MTSLRTSLTKRFIRNARSFCLTFQILLYPMRLALGVGLLHVRYLRGVLMCSFRSFTPTCTPLVPLYLGLLRYSEVHVSQSPQSSFMRYYMFIGLIVQITLVTIVSVLFLETRWPHSSIRRPCCEEVPLISTQPSSLRVHESLIW